MKKLGMDGFKIRIDLVMPSPPHVEEEEMEEYEECEECGERHCPTEECGDNTHNMRNGPLPDLEGKKPVVPSEYLERMMKIDEKNTKEKKKK